MTYLAGIGNFRVMVANMIGGVTIVILGGCVGDDGGREIGFY